MGSDDVRARAEAVALAYKNLRESISRWHGDGFAVSVNLGPLYESCDSLTAALAVAPATAQPVAYICVECGALWRKVRLPGDADESWNMISVKGCAGCDNGPKPLLDALYREPLPAPATVDAAAVRLLRTLRGWLDVNERAWREAEVGCPTLIANVDAFLDAIPLPAPATAVEEARKAFASSGSAWARHQFECPGAAFEGPGAEWFAENDALRIKAIHDHDALIAAEAAATHAAKESRSDDRPASGQGGV